MFDNWKYFFNNIRNKQATLDLAKEANTRAIKKGKKPPISSKEVYGAHKDVENLGTPKK